MGIDSMKHVRRASGLGLCLLLSSVFNGSTFAESARSSASMALMSKLESLSTWDERERLLAEALARGLGLPPQWKSIWEKDPASRIWLLNQMSWEQCSSLDEKSLDADLRSVLWMRLLKEDEASKAPEFWLKRAKAAHEGARGVERSLLDRLLSRGMFQEAHSTPKKPWKVLLGFLSSEDWNVQGDAWLQLNLWLEDLDAQRWLEAWGKSSKAGRTTLSTWTCQHPSNKWNKALGTAIEGGEDLTLLLYALYHSPAHDKSDWLFELMLNKKWDEKNLELALGTLNRWDEVKPDDRYLRFFLDRGYSQGGIAGDTVLELLGKSKHPDAVKVISRHYQESEKNPYSIDVVLMASGAHGDASFLSRMKRMLNKDRSNALLKWAIARCSGKTTAAYVVESRPAEQVRASFKIIP